MIVLLSVSFVVLSVVLVEFVSLSVVFVSVLLVLLVSLVLFVELVVYPPPPSLPHWVSLAVIFPKKVSLQLKQMFSNMKWPL